MAPFAPTPERTFHLAPPLVAGAWNFCLRARSPLSDSVDPQRIARAPFMSLEEAL